MKKARLRPGKIELRGKTPVRPAADLAADRGLAILANALEHPDPDVRARAITVVSTFSDGRTKRLLRAMMLDPSPAVRCAAIVAIGRTDSLDVVASLVVALGDPDAGVRRAAAEAVSRATGWTIGPRGTDARIDADQIDKLKRWWKQQRRAELEARGRG
jgi:HEAT repeat protein